MDAVDDYEWDAAKRAQNLRKHGVDFADVIRFDWDTAILIGDDRHDEPRIRALGFIDGRLMALIYAERGETVRVISLRRATTNEQRLFDRYR